MKNKNLIRLIGLFGGSLLLILAFILYVAPFTVTKITANITGTLSGYELIFPENGNGNSGLATAWAFSLILLILSVGTVVMLVLSMLKVWKPKGPAFMDLVCGGVFFALSLVAGILAFSTKGLLEAQNSVLGNFYLGAGAVCVGLFSILGGILACVGFAVPAILKK